MVSLDSRGINAKVRKETSILSTPANRKAENTRKITHLEISMCCFLPMKLSTRFLTWGCLVPAVWSAVYSCPVVAGTLGAALWWILCCVEQETDLPVQHPKTLFTPCRRQILGHIITNESARTQLESKTKGFLRPVWTGPKRPNDFPISKVNSHVLAPWDSRRGRRPRS